MLFSVALTYYCEDRSAVIVIPAMVNARDGNRAKVMADLMAEKMSLPDGFTTIVGGTDVCQEDDLVNPETTIDTILPSEPSHHREPYEPYTLRSR